MTEFSRIKVGATYKNIGSKKGNEQLVRNSPQVLLELGLKQVSAEFAFCGDFGDTWEGNRRFRYLAGFNLNSITSSSSNAFTLDQSIMFPEIQNDDLAKLYADIEFGLGMYLHKNLAIDMKYNHAVQSVLKDERLIGFDKLSPFFLTFELSYFFIK